MFQALLRTALGPAVAVAFVLAGNSVAVTIYVDDDAPPGGDGLTWNSSFRFLQDALTFADDLVNGVTEIRIAQGVYRPDRDETDPGGTGDQLASFYFPSMPALGGFAGIGAADPDARDIAAFPTILSGDLAGDDQNDFVNYDENSSILVHDGTIDGCTITSAQQGIRAEHLALTNCRLVLNVTAMRVHSNLDEEAITASDCVFDHNRKGISGGSAVVRLDDCQLTNHVEHAVRLEEAIIRANNCTFASNSGGACELLLTVCRFNDCDFIGNSSHLGGAIFFGPDEGGSYGRLVNCKFIDNFAFEGGAVFSEGDYYPADPHFVNCVFLRNTAVTLGGACFSEYSNPKYKNCTFVRNQAIDGGGIYHDSGVLRVFNCIIKGNYGGSISGPGRRNVYYSNIGGGQPGVGNIDVDPRFKDLLLGDLRLKASSKCIDAGSHIYIPVDILTDMAGNPRFVNVPNVPNTGTGSPPIDMGAYEFQP